MTTYAHKLEIFSLKQDVPIHVLTQTGANPVRMDDPAITAMTDLKRIRAITINPESSIEFAQQLMKYAGVRMLVVVDQASIITGLVTARDIMGEKPMTIMTQDRVRRGDIQVSHVMTPRSELNPFNYSDIEHATVRDVVVKLRDAGRQHAIVIEAQAQGPGYFLRGIFSITQIGRQLGMEISVDSQVQSFAELEKLIA